LIKIAPIFSGVFSFRMRDSVELIRPIYPSAVSPQAPETVASPNFSDQYQLLRERAINWLRSNVPEPRLRHVIRVEKMSIDLALKHRLDVEKAAQAGLMHDLAKFFKSDRLLKMAIEEGIQLDPVDEANPHLLHAEVGAIVARDEFGIRDKEVLDAIRNHTLGNPGMGPISCVVYLADGLEPGRGHSSELDELRRISRQDLIEATWKAADHSIRHLIQSRFLIHPRAIQTRNWFLQAATPRSRKS
jgi:predicted HD superfamily hydrolase involved in NAD metabolism